MALTQIKTTGLADDAVTSAKIADDAVVAAAIADDAVVTAAIADDAVTGANIADDTVAEANMANDAISLTELKAGTDGQIISWDASGNPVAIGPGTDGQVLTSTGAGSPPAFEDAAGGGAALTGSTDNTVCTVTGANAIQGEAALTFDGTTLGINNPTPKFTLTDSDTTGPPVCLVDGSGGDLDLESDINNAKNDSKVRVFIDGSEKVRFQTGGGMSFNGDTAAANALDDYEEGDWTPTSPSSTVSSNSGKYTKIGRHVLFEGSLTFGSESGNNAAQINGLPFNASGAYGGGYIRYTNVNPGEEWFSLDIPSGNDYIQMNESSPDSIKRNDVSTKRIDFCGQYIA